MDEHKITEAKGYTLKFKFVFGKLSCLSLNSGLSYAAKLISFFQIPSTSAIVDCLTSFKINSTTYRINESVLLVPHSIVNPYKNTFALIIKIVMHQNKIAFVCKVQKIFFFNIYKLSKYLTMIPS
jgi:hypothetical protein